MVRSVAVAHGWEVSITEADGGGARFQFTGPRVGQESDPGAARTDGTPSRSS